MWLLYIFIGIVVCILIYIIIKKWNMTDKEADDIVNKYEDRFML